MPKRKSPPKATTEAKEEMDVKATDDAAEKEEITDTGDVEMNENTEAGDVETNEDTEVGDENEETDDGIPLFIPSLNEFHRDLGESYNPRTLNVGPVSFTDLNRGKLSLVIQKADYCQVKLAKKDGVLKGYLELMFESEEVATSCLSELESYKEKDVIVKHLKRVDDKPVDVSDIKASLDITTKINSDAVAERIVVVTQLPTEVTAEEIKEKIKEATSVMFPQSQLTNERKSYAYVELPYHRNAQYHNGWNLTFGEQKSKCRMLEQIPKVGNVLADLRKFESRVEKKEPLDPIARWQLKELLKHGIHYSRSEYIDAEKKESLNSLMEAGRTCMAIKGDKTGKKPIDLSNMSQLEAQDILKSLTALNRNKKFKRGRNQRW